MYEGGRFLYKPVAKPGQFKPVPDCHRNACIDGKVGMYEGGRFLYKPVEKPGAVSGFNEEFSAKPVSEGVFSSAHRDQSRVQQGNPMLQPLESRKHGPESLQGPRLFHNERLR